MNCSYLKFRILCFSIASGFSPMTKINSKLALAEIDTKVLAKANLIILF
ncbi:hypothetical protein SAMN05421800_1174 [Chryseobacterium balustinum]|uniref:Uncharacterized protein n=1 Tax=Chryseobacterium balustinum TaxID=246 RepID=A0AAX2IIV1_9FLAO|nr:hypothetical protein SAMN05421800_1174 [Chryseobacterium balustinum]SQA88748.1 Uncharacterised protein [Chryseobacterium balustinum]